MTDDRDPSIQGEQQPDSGPTEYLTESEVDEYADCHSEEVVECRPGCATTSQPPKRGEVATFVGRDDIGLYVSKTDCRRCGLAYRVEKWEPVRQGPRAALEAGL